MTTLTFADFGIIASIIGVPFGLVMFMLRGAHKRIDNVEKRVQDVETGKVGKRDWLRESLSTRSKVDRVSEQLAAIAARLDAAFGMASAMDRVAEAISKFAEKKL